jgi:AraC-like DNA-binding protein
MMANITHRVGARIAPGSPGATGKWPDMRLYGALFAGAVVSFCLARLIGDRLGPAVHLFVVAGSATCGWSWLVSRALFRVPQERAQMWPLALVLAMVSVEALLRFHGDRTTPIARMAGNAEALVSSTLLLLAMVEPLRDVRRGMPKPELQFRTLFAGGYAILLMIAVVGVDGAPAGGVANAWSGTVKVTCAALALVGTALAIRYRGDNPLTLPCRAKGRPAMADADGLGERLVAMIRDEAIYALPDLRMADVARRLREPDYKATQCVTRTLGFRNFNHMVNHFRVAEAKRRFADAALDRLPVLTIAFDCGFGSIGPFNRAFKAETGTTPVQYRKAALRSRL